MTEPKLDPVARSLARVAARGDLHDMHAFYEFMKDVPKEEREPYRALLREERAIFKEEKISTYRDLMGDFRNQLEILGPLPWGDFDRTDPDARKRELMASRLFYVSREAGPRGGYRVSKISAYGPAGHEERSSVDDLALFLADELRLNGFPYTRIVDGKRVRGFVGEKEGPEVTDEEWEERLEEYRGLNLDPTRWEDGFFSQWFGTPEWDEGMEMLKEVREMNSGKRKRTWA